MRRLMQVSVALVLALVVVGAQAKTPAKGAKKRPAKGAAVVPGGTVGGPADGPGVVTVDTKGSPLVSVRLVVRAGSEDDPKGKEGLAALTALMVGEAGTAKRSYKDLSEALYPMAASIGVSTDRELTVIGGKVHKDNLDAWLGLLEEAVLTPGFDEADLQRNRQQLLSHLKTRLRSASDELLGLEAIQGAMYHGHPYEHAPAGTVQGLGAITMDDVRAFWKEHYTQGRITVGVAADGPEALAAGLVAALRGLPAGVTAVASLPPAPVPEGRRITVIDKPTASVGLHFGAPIAVTRASDDYWPLMIANSWLGEHRTFNGVLMRELRAVRGLNYGDYSYIEHWANPPGTSHPTPGHGRRSQAFTVWIRPVEPKNALFALRAALHFVDVARDKGMTQAELDATRDYLNGYSKLWAQTQTARLGFAMDSRFYGMPPYIEEIERRLAGVTLEQVNAAIRAHMSADAWEAVVVGSDGEKLAEALRTDAPAPITYESAPSAAVLEEDKAIEARKIAPTEVRVVPVAEMFER